jgi:predicted translin family RNA/ssDNA-binding protein
MKKEEIIWVSREIANKFKEATSDENKEKILSDMIEFEKKEIQTEMEMLEERTQEFKLIGLKYKNTMKEIKNAQIEEMGQLWEEINNYGYDIRSKVESFKNQLSPISKEIKELKKELDSINTYKGRDLIDLSNTVIGMSDKQLEILKEILIIQKEKK